MKVTFAKVHDQSAFFNSVAATRFLEPDPHREMTLIAWVKGTFHGVPVLPFDFFRAHPS
jgi:hypothetical protein